MPGAMLSCTLGFCDLALVENYCAELCGILESSPFGEAGKVDAQHRVFVVESLRAWDTSKSYCRPGILLFFNAIRLPQNSTVADVSSLSNTSQVD